MSNMNPLTRGIAVFVMLAVLTGIEYVLGILHVTAVLLWLVALMKAGLVLWFFMHLPRVFKPGEGDH